MTSVSEQPSVVDSQTPVLTGNRTRSGRVSKPPVRYEPVEKVEDDYASDEYDEIESEVGSGVAYSDSELEGEDEDDDSEMDDFIVQDKSESDEDDNGDAGRGPAAAGPKRPTVAPVRKSAAKK